MKFEIYSKAGCGYCVKAKNLLKEHNKSFVEYNLDGVNVTKEQIQERIQKLGLSHQVRTVPQIFYTDSDNKVHYIGGFTELSTRKDLL